MKSFLKMLTEDYREQSKTGLGILIVVLMSIGLGWLGLNLSSNRCNFVHNLKIEYFNSYGLQCLNVYTETDDGLGSIYHLDQPAIVASRATGWSVDGSAFVKGNQRVEIKHCGYAPAEE